MKSFSKSAKNAGEDLQDLIDAKTRLAKLKGDSSK
jgi:hypothetical protein